MDKTCTQNPRPMLAGTILVLTLGLFALDLLIPLGVVVAVLYTVPILLTLWQPRRRATLAVATGASALTVLGMLISPLGPPWWAAVANCALELTAIWISATLILLHRRGIEVRQEQEAHVRLLLEQLPAVVWATDSSLKVTLAQGAGLAGPNLTPKEMVGTRVSEYFPDEPDNRVVTIHHRALQGKPGSYEASWGHRLFRAFVEPMRLPDGTIAGCIGMALDITAEKQAELERERLIRELRGALSTIKTLNEMLPICASCKRIQDDRGAWTQIEQYLYAHSDAKFSHGICPECRKTLYPELLASI